MILTKTQTLNERLPLQEQIRLMDLQYRKVVNLANGRIRFGDAADGEQGENISGEFQQFTTDATPDTEFSVTHTLGAIPRGYLIFWQDIAGSLYQSPTSGTDWTTTAVSLSCSVGSVTYLVFLVK